MIHPLIFLDVDGVLNDHAMHTNGYCGIKPACVASFNRVLSETGARIVVSSAWRYLVHSGSMTLVGLENLFLSHGLDCRGRVVGLTVEDGMIPTRGGQILAWMREHGWNRPYAVVDDLDAEADIQIRAAGHPFVQTDGTVGLTDEDADCLIAILEFGMARAAL